MDYLKNVVHKFEDAQKYLGNQEFWCSICDEIVVKTSEPNTGDWFQVSGHLRILSSSLAIKDRTGEYECVIFAVCKSCQKP